MLMLENGQKINCSHKCLSTEETTLHLISFSNSKSGNPTLQNYLLRRSLSSLTRHLMRAHFLFQKDKSKFPRFVSLTTIKYCRMPRKSKKNNNTSLRLCMSQSSVYKKVYSSLNHVYHIQLYYCKKKRFFPPVKFKIQIFVKNILFLSQ